MTLRGTTFAGFIVALVLALALPLRAAAQNPPTEAELLQRLAANPTDVATCLDLARMYQQAGRLYEAARMLTTALTQIKQQLQAMDKASTPANSTTPIRVGGGVMEPKKIRDVKPLYPEDARAAGVEGVVILEAVIETDGTVRAAKVLRSVPMLDQAALDAVMQWQFTPTLLNGTPVPVVMTVSMSFSLK
jgi:TonB family protein